MLVIHDGVNEAMALMGAEIKDVDGAATFRRRARHPVPPASVPPPSPATTCRSTPRPAVSTRSARSTRVMRSTGARIQLINETRSAAASAASRRLRDQGPARASAHPWQAHQDPRQDVHGDAEWSTTRTAFAPSDAVLRAEAADDAPRIRRPRAPTPFAARWSHELPGHPSARRRLLFAEMRQAGRKGTEAQIKAAVDDLLVAGRLTEVIGEALSKDVRGCRDCGGDCGGTAAEGGLDMSTTAACDCGFPTGKQDPPQSLTH